MKRGASLALVVVLGCNHRSRPPATVSAASCSSVRGLVLAVTADDVQSAQEAAQ